MSLLTKRAKRSMELVLEIQPKLITLCNLNISISCSDCEEHDGAFYSLQVILPSSTDRLSLIGEQALPMNFYEFICSEFFFIMKSVYYIKNVYHNGSSFVKQALIQYCIYLFVPWGCKATKANCLLLETS